jgi:pimeloyl-ACP methyl ester carboxylesterase
LAETNPNTTQGPKKASTKLKKLGRGVLAIVSVLALLVLFNFLRHYVYWSPHEELSFSNGPVVLAGTLVKPSGDGPFPAVLLLHGSGPEPRAEPPTRAVVNALVRNGFAVMLYDKRGVAQSTGDFDSATFRDFIDDAIAGVEYLAGRDDTRPNNVGLYAVSEGGWFAPEIAVSTQKVGFIFNKVGPPLSWMNTVKWEVRNDFIADGIAAKDVQPLVDLAVDRWTYYIDTAADASLASGARRDAINARITELRRDLPGADQVLSEQLRPYEEDFYQAFAADAAYDPTPFLARLDVPMYYAYGGSDINIPTEQCVATLLKMGAEQGKNITFEVYPGLGHSLATPKGLLSMGFPPGYLKTLGEWCREQVE